MGDRSQRPWWQKKRWLTAGLFLLLASYPSSWGPVHYYVAGHRGGAVAHAAEVFYQPLIQAYEARLLPRWYEQYLARCYRAGSPHSNRGNFLFEAEEAKKAKARTAARAKP